MVGSYCIDRLKPLAIRASEVIRLTSEALCCLMGLFAIVFLPVIHALKVIKCTPSEGANENN